MKCPACGFDSPDDAPWCDLCKEPLRKQADKKPPVMKDDEKVPLPPPWLRAFAWGFLGLWIVIGLVLAAIALRRYR
ncbi:MAG: hypothetical protein AAB320_11170 [Elusimicrobiota bacterium]